MGKKSKEYTCRLVLKSTEGSSGVNIEIHFTPSLNPGCQDNLPAANALGIKLVRIVDLLSSSAAFQEELDALCRKHSKAGE